MSASVSAASLGPMPPSVVLDDFLDSATHRALLEWALANADRFQPATIGRGRAAKVDPATRNNLKFAELGTLRPTLRDRLFAALPQLSADLGCQVPPDVQLELELTAYGDGAFYEAHTDIGLARGPDDPDGAETDPRLISAVYYFHRQPKAFDGGALRLHRWGAGDPAEAANHRDHEPADNRLVAFLSWARHEVLPVRCPSRSFADYRFALNCWFRLRPPA